MPFIKSSIDDLCIGAGLTQRQLAKEVGVSQTTIYRWLNVEGDVPRLSRVDVLYQIANKYKLTIEFYEKPK